MASAAENIRDNIRDQFLQCKICLDGLKMPKTLPCLHTFCTECIMYYIEHNRFDTGRKFHCPICRRIVFIPKDGAMGFPDSFFVTNLTEIVTTSETTLEKPHECGICKFKDGAVEATVLCIECKVELCRVCAGTHSSAKVTENHTLLPLAQATGSTNRENYCRVHKGETIKYYCETCNSPICLPCTFLDHQGHEIEEIKKVRQNFNQDMEQLVIQSEDNILQLVQAKDNLLELESELFLRKESIKMEVRRAIQEILKSLNGQESQLLAEVDHFYDTVSVGHDRQKMERTIFKLDRAHDFAKVLISSETSPIAQLVNRNEAKGNLHEALNYELPDVMRHEQKLDRYIYFLPGKVDINLGSLLKCTKQGFSNTISELRPVLPSSRAIFLHKVKMPSGQDMGEVVSLAILPCGDIIAVTSTSGKKVKLFSSRGHLRHEFGDSEELQHPSDVTITRRSEIAISDCGFRVVKVFDQMGIFSFQFGGENTFCLPISLATDHMGKYLVCDQAKQRVTIHRSCGEFLAQIPICEILSPQYIACCEGKVYICDTDNNVITIYNYDGADMHLIAKMAATDICDKRHSFLDCSGICVDRNGSLCISDSLQDRIHVFNSRGELSNIVAHGGRFLHPTCIAISSEGILAAAQQGFLDMDTGVSVHREISVYRLTRTDI